MASYSAIQAAWKKFGGDKIKMGQWVDENRVSDQDLADALGYSTDDVKAWLSEADVQRGAAAKSANAPVKDLNLGGEPALQAGWIKNGLSAEDFYKRALDSNQGYTVDPKTGALMSSAGNAPWAVDQFGPEPEGYGKTETQIPLANGNAGNIVNGKLVDTGRPYTAKEDFMTKYGVTLTGLALGGIAAGAGAGAVAGGTGSEVALGGIGADTLGAAGDYSLAELANIAGSAEGATGLTAASLAQAGVPQNIISQGASAISKFLKENKDTISLVGTGAGLAGIAGSLLSGDNKTTTTTTTKEG
ncbi:MAG: hypothetical protein NUW01_14080, partial [Gemmatimonadaceae bacterium]|nr:hypothetical protein [Gemmatimonadaceae bacterium]